MSYLQIGSLSLPTIWLAVVAALFITSVLHWAITRTKLEDWYWNGFFLYFLTWKLTYILFNFQLFLDMPLSIVYFNGGTAGHFIALALLSVYLLFFAGKKYPTVYAESAEVLLSFFISYKALSFILEKDVVGLVLQFILLVSYLFLLTSIKRKQKRLTAQPFILFILLELLMLSMFDTILSVEALTFLWLGITAFLLSRYEQGGRNH
ncbi:hypothetical protein SAMN05192533_103301 [Mesobacillus persicus]|uniref:Uncharacterized protein n=1 Tax=Mesobacillus persicus TaxID=930146 RepID=A0A1H7Z9V7_9BACI|nr:hypothetical protein [Mesobacillus persicus]SEM54338.1 hypothetical protein SAMN05192533_103301 [Mesobacillus persicus]